MTPAGTAYAAAVLLCLGTAAAAQDTGAAPRGTTASDQGVPSPRDPIDRPKRGRLIDLIKTIAPPLIEAASRPRPPREPVPEPIAPATAELPVAPAAVLAPAGPGAVVVPPPSPPRPTQTPLRAVATEPKPPAPRLLPTAVAIPQAPPATRPAPTPPEAPPAETLAPLASPAVPPVADQRPPPAPIVRAETPPAAVEPMILAPWWSGPAAPWLAVLAVIVVLAGANHLRRMRRIARTRAALALSPRLDLDGGAGSISGLSLAAPPLSIRARLAPAGE